MKSKPRTAEKSKTQKTPPRSNAPLFFAGIASLFAAFGVASALYLWRFPEIWADSSTRTTTVFRVQSRSMEPTFCGPRFVWRCPECGETFATSLDVESSGSVDDTFFDVETPIFDVETPIFGAKSNAIPENAPSSSNADSPEVRRFRETARFFACPSCGFDRVPASSAVFQDGALVEFSSRFETSGAENALNGGNWRNWKSWREALAPKSKKNAPGPNRWDVVIFRAPTGRATMKRVVGLPGETVRIQNGDVFVDGAPPRRPLDEIFSTATRIDSVEIRRTDSRLSFVRVAPIWNDAANAVSRTKFVPTPISNESPIPRWNGNDVAPVELVRDFLARFSWTNADGRPIRFAVLARRPERVFCLEYDEKSRRVSLRSTKSFGDKTSRGKTFEQITQADFADAPVERAAVDLAPDAANGSAVFDVFLVDGELILARNGVETARFSTGDVESTATAAISEPFAILGDVSRVGAPTLRRDLHYSTVGGASAAIEIPPLRYFLLGDNSPASFDGRFAEFGTIDAADVLFRAASRPPILEEF